MVYSSQGHLDVKHTAIEDFARRVMKDYDQPYRRKYEVIVFLGSPLEFESNAWKAADSIIFTRPSTYDTANKEHYLGWFTLTEDYTNFGGVSLLQDPVLDGPTKEFRCEPSADGRHVDLYTSMGPKECLLWVERQAQASPQQLVLERSEEKLGLPFISRQCATCHGTHRETCPYDRYLSEPEPDDTPVATFNDCDSLLFRHDLVRNIISRVQRDKFILVSFHRLFTI